MSNLPPGVRQIDIDRQTWDDDDDRDVVYWRCPCCGASGRAVDSDYLYCDQCGWNDEPKEPTDAPKGSPCNTLAAPTDGNEGSRNELA